MEPTYAAWLSSAASDGAFDPYYSQEVLRFELRDTDVLVAAPGVSAEPAPCGTMLRASAGAQVTVCGISPKDAAGCLAAIDGARTVAGVRLAARVDAPAWDAFQRGAFGVAIFAPFALAELEARVSHAEIVRFPGSPYEIIRAYWENMADVAERLANLHAEVPDANAFTALLSELDVLSLVGASGRSFYRPASPVVAKEPPEPGVLWHLPSVLEQTADGVRFVSGPRVGAAPIGGERYESLLVDSLPSAPLTGNSGLPWGEVVTARADGDEHAAPWFCPPRPLTVAHFDEIRRDFNDALGAAGDRERVVASLAALHWRLVRLHPFKSGNQSVAMGLVNAVLRRAFGAGMSHLVLDHLAFRLSAPAYGQVFARAVAEWLVVDESPVRRALELASRRRRTFQFLETLRDAPAVEALTRTDDARLALLDVRGGHS